MLETLLSVTLNLRLRDPLIEAGFGCTSSASRSLVELQQVRWGDTKYRLPPAWRRRVAKPGLKDNVLRA